MDEIITPDATAKILCIGVKTLANWRHVGKGPKFLKIGHSVRYSRNDIEAYIAKNRRESTFVPRNVKTR